MITSATGTALHLYNTLYMSLLKGQFNQIEHCLGFICSPRPIALELNGIPQRTITCIPGTGLSSYSFHPLNVTSFDYPYPLRETLNKNTMLNQNVCMVR